jgi:hypothetical protein
MPSTIKPVIFYRLHARFRRVLAEAKEAPKNFEFLGI